ncbi:MAG TPA: aminotransferase class IV [Armatimonadota bacterium]
MDGWAWFEGEVVRLADVRLSALERGFLYGDGLYETFRTYSGVPCLVQEHWQRLEDGARILEIRLPDGWRERLTQAVRRVTKASGEGDLRFRVTISRGTGGPADGEPLGEPTVLVAATSLRGHVAGRCQTACLSPYPHGRVSPLSRVKTTSLVTNIMSKRHAARAGFDEALLISHSGLVVEGATCNVAAIISGAVVSPGPEQGALPGVTQAQVMRIAGRVGIPFRLAPLTLAELESAGEAFVTSSVREITPLVRIGDRPIGDGVPGPITRQLQDMYSWSVRDAVARGW